MLKPEPLGMDHLIFRGGGWDCFEKNSLFPNRGEKNKMSSTKLKIKILFFIQCIDQHVDLPLPSSVLNVNYKTRKIHRNICKD